MKLHHFREVVAIAQWGSIRAAARDLEMAQPALTRSLAELERELGAPLFERRSTGVSATPVGQAFVRRAAAVLQDVRRAREEVDQLRGLSAGTVTAGLSIAVHLALLPSALQPFQSYYADVVLDIIEGHYPTLEAGLRDGVIDFFVGPDPGEQLAPELTREVLVPNRRMVIGRAGHPLAAASSLAQLCQVKWVATPTTAGAEDEIGPLFRRHGLPAPAIAIRSHSALTLVTCLSHSDLLALAPIQWSKFAFAGGSLSAIPVAEELSAPAIVIVKRSDLPLTPAATYLLDLIRRAQARLAANAKSTSPAPI